jgi:hypothetical protein
MIGHPGNLIESMGLPRSSRRVSSEFAHVGYPPGGAEPDAHPT